MPSREHSPFSLVGGLQEVLRCDRSDPILAIFNFYLAERTAARLLVGALDRLGATPLPALVALIHGARSFLSVRVSDHGNHVVSVSLRENERRSLRKLESTAGAGDWTHLACDGRISFRAIRDLIRCMRDVQNVARVSRILRRVHKKERLFHALRVAELIFFYLRYLQIFERHNFRLAVMSSNANPHGIAFNVASIRSGIPVVMITHGMPPSSIGRLYYDVAIVDSETAKRIYERGSSGVGTTVVKSRQSLFSPMPAAFPAKGLSVGLFLSKDPRQASVLPLIELLASSPSVSKVLIRPHPANLSRWILDRTLPVWSQRVCVSSGGPASQDLSACDIIFAGNSAVHAEAAISGTPSCYVQGLDHAPGDYYGFVEAGLIFSMEPDASFDPRAVLEFYNRPAWASILALYGNIEQSEDEVGALIRELFSALLDGSQRFH